MAKQYIALIQEGFVRDAQVFVGDPAVEQDVAGSEDWADFKRPELFLGLFEGETEEEALSKAAEYAGCHKACLRMVDLENS